MLAKIDDNEIFHFIMNQDFETVINLCNIQPYAYNKN